MAPGYSAPGREKIQKRTHAGDDSAPSGAEVQRDIKESFESGREGYIGQPNIWYPEGVLPGFKEGCLDFYEVRAYWKRLCYMTNERTLIHLAGLR